MKNTIANLNQAELNYIAGGSKEFFPIPSPDCNKSEPACQEEINRYKKLQFQWAGKMDKPKFDQVKKS
ncbi:MAG: hypothetical protein KKE11_02470 [Gammaproteobacteria bacterium]|nr:hypothetical protein [Gammaproteobacteria bacterium]